MHNVQSPRTDDDAVEQMIQAKRLSAPRLTPADIEAAIDHVEYVKHVSVGRQVLRWAVITTKSGFAVTGRPSASVSPENDDAEVGERVALANAKNELWPLLGFALKARLAEQTTLVSAMAERAEITPEQLQEMPRKLLDLGCRVRSGECLFRDDELIDQAAAALRAAVPA